MSDKLINRIIEKLLIKDISKITAKIFKIILSDRKRPFFLQIEPATTCNLDCAWCIHSKVSSDNFKKMSFENFKRLIDQFPFIFVLKFAGIGEFFTNKDFNKMICYLKKKKVFYSCFTSSFTVLGEEEIKNLAESNINTVFISLDGATKETFAKIRKGSNLDRIIENIKKFQKVRKKTKIIIRTIMSNQNKHELFKIVNLVQSLGIDQLHFQRLYENPELQLTTEEYLDFKKRLKKYARIKLKFSEFTTKPIYKCLRGLGVMYVSVEGYALPCTILTQRDDYFELGKKEGFGNVFEKSVKEIWNSPKYKKFRQKILKGDVPEICVGCPYYEKLSI